MIGVLSLDSGLKIVLASSSPRRQELMRTLGVEFTIIEPSSDEPSNNLDPRTRAIQNAESKALSVKEQSPNSLIIGADTIVYLDGLFLGKPRDSEDAINMLELLSGRKHQVFTGLMVLDSSSGKSLTGCSVTDVFFKKLSKKQIEEYVATGEPMDKAGAYAIQGAGEKFIEEITGSWSNVIGLPLELLRELLAKIDE